MLNLNLTLPLGWNFAEEFFSQTHAMWIEFESKIRAGETVSWQKMNNPNLASRFFNYNEAQTRLRGGSGIFRETFIRSDES